MGDLGIEIIKLGLIGRMTLCRKLALHQRLGTGPGWRNIDLAFQLGLKPVDLRIEAGELGLDLPGIGGAEGGIERRQQLAFGDDVAGFDRERADDGGFERLHHKRRLAGGQPAWGNHDLVDARHARPIDGAADGQRHEIERQPRDRRGAPLLERNGVGLEIHDRVLLDRWHHLERRLAWGLDQFDGLGGFGGLCWCTHPTSFICWVHNCR
jgi:hypothetical protein